MTDTYWLRSGCAYHVDTARIGVAYLRTLAAGSPQVGLVVAVPGQPERDLVLALGDTFTLGTQAWSLSDVEDEGDGRFAVRIRRSHA